MTLPETQESWNQRKLESSFSQGLKKICVIIQNSFLFLDTELFKFFSISKSLQDL